MYRLGAWVALALVMSACGIKKKEHARLMDEQKQALTGDMAKAQAACDTEIRDRDNVIEGLETKVEGMGGDLDRVREELGARAKELASTRTELFDLVADPLELLNIIDDPAYAEVRVELEGELARLQAELGDEPYPGV